MQGPATAQELKTPRGRLAVHRTGRNQRGQTARLKPYFLMTKLTSGKTVDSSVVTVSFSTTSSSSVEPRNFHSSLNYAAPHSTSRYHFIPRLHHRYRLIIDSLAMAPESNLRSLVFEGVASQGAPRCRSLTRSRERRTSHSRSHRLKYQRTNLLLILSMSCRLGLDITC